MTYINDGKLQSPVIDIVEAHLTLIFNVFVLLPCVHCTAAIPTKVDGVWSPALARILDTWIKTAKRT